VAAAQQITSKRITWVKSSVRKTVLPAYKLVMTNVGLERTTYNGAVNFSKEN